MLKTPQKYCKRERTKESNQPEKKEKENKKKIIRIRQQRWEKEIYKHGNS